MQWILHFAARARALNSNPSRPSPSRSSFLSSPPAVDRPQRLPYVEAVPESRSALRERDELRDFTHVQLIRRSRLA